MHRALGRFGLAALTHRAVERVPSLHRAEAEALGTWVTGGGTRRWWLVAAAYFMGPFPSNAPFIAAGAGGFRAGRLAVVFALSLAVSDTCLVWVAGRAAPSAVHLAKRAFTHWRVAIVQVAAVVAVILVFRLPWSRWLGR